MIVFQSCHAHNTQILPNDCGANYLPEVKVHLFLCKNNNNTNSLDQNILSSGSLFKMYNLTPRVTLSPIPLLSSMDNSTPSKSLNLEISLRPTSHDPQKKILILRSTKPFFSTCPFLTTKKKILSLSAREIAIPSLPPGRRSFCVKYVCI